MAITEEVSLWIVQLSNGDEQAAQALWNQYFDKMVRFARRKLEGMPRRALDEEDVALSAMHSFCRGMAAHKFPEIADRESRHPSWRTWWPRIAASCSMRWGTNPCGKSRS